MFIKSTCGVYSTNGFMLHPLCAFILGGKTPQSCVTMDSTKGADFVAQSLWTDGCGVCAADKGWRRCAGVKNQRNTVGFSGATSFPNTGSRSRTQSSCWGLPTSDEPGVMLSFIMLRSSLHIQPHLCALSWHVSVGRTPFSLSPGFTERCLPFWKLKRQKALLFERVG